VRYVPTAARSVRGVPPAHRGDVHLDVRVELALRHRLGHTRDLVSEVCEVLEGDGPVPDLGRSGDRVAHLVDGLVVSTAVAGVAVHTSTPAIGGVIGVMVPPMTLPPAPAP
jgi:hypothetical protein